MRLIAFDIEDAKAGKTIYTRDGREAKYLKPHGDNESIFEIDGTRYVINNNGRAKSDTSDSRYDLFIDSDELGPSMFDDKLRKILIEHKSGKYDNMPMKDVIRRFSRDLLKETDFVRKPRHEHAKNTNDSEAEKTNVTWKHAEKNLTMVNNVIVIRSNSEGQKSISLVKKVKEGEYYLTLDDLEKILK